MKRRDFLEICSALAASSPFFSMLACQDARPTDQYWDLDIQFQGKVVVIGAGAAGLAAGYLLARHGVEFEILEASDRIGGRVKQIDDFIDLPLDVGAEWIHDKPTLLPTLVDDSSVDASVETIRYAPQTLSFWNGKRLLPLNIGTHFYAEYKFRRTTWWQFLDGFLAESCRDKIRLQTPVSAIDSSGERIQITTEGGEVVEADKVLVCTPLKILQRGDIAFTPPIPEALRGHMDSVLVPPGIKMSLEFSERFYPDMLSIGSSFDKLYIDGVFGKPTDRHVMHLFWVAPGASEFTDLSDDDALQAALDELDTIFDGAASQHFVQGVVQNWAAEPYIGGAYGWNWNGDFVETVEGLRGPHDTRVHFASAATSVDATSTVHGAIQEAYEGVVALLGSA